MVVHDAQRLVNEEIPSASLFIRGQGDGLSWEKGQPLTCVESDTWVWSTPSANHLVRFKLLLNDQVWTSGDDLIVQEGQRLEFVPTFL